jgi:hypothetical protein
MSASHLLLLLLLQSLPSIIFVEAAEGDSLGLITNRSQLDALMASLNKRGTRESALHQVGQKPLQEVAEQTRCNSMRQSAMFIGL